MLSIERKDRSNAAKEEQEMDRSGTRRIAGTVGIVGAVALGTFLVAAVLVPILFAFWIIAGMSGGTWG
jgi:hypothetical protein